MVMVVGWMAWGGRVVAFAFVVVLAGNVVVTAVAGSISGDDGFSGGVDVDAVKVIFHRQNTLLVPSPPATPPKPCRSPSNPPINQPTNQPTHSPPYPHPSSHPRPHPHSYHTPTLTPPVFPPYPTPTHPHPHPPGKISIDKLVRSRVMDELLQLRMAGASDGGQQKGGVGDTGSGDGSEANPGGGEGLPQDLSKNWFSAESTLRVYGEVGKDSARKMCPLSVMVVWWWWCWW